jgi:hypothetical protein
MKMGATGLFVFVSGNFRTGNLTQFASTRFVKYGLGGDNRRCGSVADMTVFCNFVIFINIVLVMT